ncbi:MAG: MarR family transcriptional regulator [Candidatus Marinimicrobia bacterium]|nr:MarR family transcriptional regulator [Candidatus Neomarinimicrobiota bacterium]
MKELEEKRDRSLGKIISELSRLSGMYFQKQFKRYDIGPSQVTTLHFISRHNGITQSDLTHFLNLDKSSVSSQLHTLEKNGYIVRIAAKDDNRIKKIYISEKTRTIESPLHNVFTSWTDTLLADLSEEEREQLFLLLEKVKGNAKKRYGK